MTSRATPTGVDTAAGTGPSTAPGPDTGAAPDSTAPPPTIAELLAHPPAERDPAWVRRSLQVAIAIELATVPPYLYAYWSVKEVAADLADTLLGIAWQEMYHMGLVCNLLSAVGGTPSVLAAVPRYPTRLPGGVRPEVTVILSGVSPRVEEEHDVLKTFMDIEEPENPLAYAAAGPTIGQFYQAIHDALPGVGFVQGIQHTDHIGGDRLVRIGNLKQAQDAITVIREQGEGTSVSPNGSKDPADRAHYYRFKEHWKGRRLVWNAAARKWEFTGEPLPRPALRPLGQVPAGGWPLGPGPLRNALDACNSAYWAILSDLDNRWRSQSQPDPGRTGRLMRELSLRVSALLDLQAGASGMLLGPEFLPPARTRQGGAR